MTREELIERLRAGSPELAQKVEERVSSLPFRIGGDSYPHIVPDSFRLDLLYPGCEKCDGGRLYSYRLAVFYEVDSGKSVEEKARLLPVAFSSEEEGRAFILALEEK
jgi:hypothetical protein